LFTILTLWLTIHLDVHFSAACSKIVVAHYANTGKETLSLFIDSSIDTVSVAS